MREFYRVFNILIYFLQEYEFEDVEIKYGILQVRSHLTHCFAKMLYGQMALYLNTLAYATSVICITVITLEF